MACSLAPMASVCLPTHGLEHPSRLAFSLSAGDVLRAPGVPSEIHMCCAQAKANTDFHEFRNRMMPSG
jgi:hypothetical protein